MKAILLVTLLAMAACVSCVEVEEKLEGINFGPLRDAVKTMQGYMNKQPSGFPLYPGFVSGMVYNDKLLPPYYAGYAVRWINDTAELAVKDRVKMTADTIFDMASCSKLFTTLSIMTLVEEGKVDINSKVSVYLPKFASNGKGDITVVQLLTHTSGLLPDPVPSLTTYSTHEQKVNAILETVPQYAPGTHYQYSDLNLLTTGLIVEKLTGKTLDKVVEERITKPLGMVDTGYNPPKSKLNRIAATEFQPTRGMLRGSVEDENAWALGGVAGHAGVFSTVKDISIMARAVLNGGQANGKRILKEETVKMMLKNYNQKFPDNSHGLGFELAQGWYMGELSSITTAGHTGYTGTDVVISQSTKTIGILLTNRVHPSRNWGSINPARIAWSNGVARSIK
eukprot:TRINITY_DN10188_c0_g1_i1.p1 TRINITY_DN10188_c0_g1~~TRINITY_DN10188_c0_g1_i1.p1  ORF type:complete len:395 (+),score=169.51 TRINITY_DN10188_c0_g1_i1:69-1253(+)